MLRGGDDQQRVADFQGQLGDAAGDVHAVAVHGEHHAVVALAEIRVGEGEADQRGLVADDQFGDDAIHRGQHLRADRGEQGGGFGRPAAAAVDGNQEAVVLFHGDRGQGQHHAGPAAADFHDVDAIRPVGQRGLGERFADDGRMPPISR